MTMSASTSAPQLSGGDQPPYGDLRQIPYGLSLLALVMINLTLGTIILIIANFVSVNSAVRASTRSAAELPAISALRAEVFRLDAQTAAELSQDLPNYAAIDAQRAAVAARLKAMQTIAAAEPDEYARALDQLQLSLQTFDVQMETAKKARIGADLSTVIFELRRSFGLAESQLDALYQYEEQEFLEATNQSFATVRTVQGILVGASVMIFALGAVFLFSLRQSVRTEISRAYNRLQVAAEVGRAASSILDLDELFTTTLNLIRDRFGYYHASIFLMDDDGQSAVLREATGEAGRQLKERGLRLDIGAPSIVGSVAANRAARVVADVETDPTYLWSDVLTATRSEIALPLIVGEHLLGVLDVQAEQREAFSEADVSVLQTLADQVAVAIGTAAQYTAEQTRARQMTILSEAALEMTGPQVDESSVLRLIAQNAARLVDVQSTEATHLGVWLPTGSDELELKVEVTALRSATTGHAQAGETVEDPLQGTGRRLPQGEAAPAARRVFETGEVIRHAPGAVEDAPRLQGDEAMTLAVPMLWQGVVIGVITATRPQHGGPFTVEDERAIQLLATQAATALENARLLNETQRRAAQLAVSAEVARVANTLHDLPELLKTTVGLISERFGFYHAGIFLLDDNREWAVLQAANSPGGQRMLARGHRLRVGQQGIVGYATGTGQPRIALDVGADAVHFQNPDLPKTHSEMALPLTARGEVIGALDVQSVVVNAFRPEDVKVLQILADQLSVAIENARLFEATRRNLEELRSLQAEARQSLRVAGDAERGKNAAFSYDGVEVRPLTAPAESVAGDDPAALQIPLNVGGLNLGALRVKRPGGGWSEEDRAISQAIAERMALALENARLFEATRNTLAQTARLYEASRDITAARDLQGILRAVFLHALAPHYARFTVAFVELDANQPPDGDLRQVSRLSTVAVWSKDGGARYGAQSEHLFSIEQLPLIRLLRPDGLIVLPSLDAPEMDDLSRTVFRLQGVQALAGIPLVAGGSFIGAFLAGTAEPHEFGDEEIRPLQALADLTSVAIQNLRLLEQTQLALEETRLRAQREQTLAAITVRLQSAVTMKNILRVAAEELRHATGSTRAVVRLGRD